MYSGDAYSTLPLLPPLNMCAWNPPPPPPPPPPTAPALQHITNRLAAIDRIPRCCVLAPIGDSACHIACDSTPVQPRTKGIRKRRAPAAASAEEPNKLARGTPKKARSAKESERYKYRTPFYEPRRTVHGVVEELMSKANGEVRGIRHAFAEDRHAEGRHMILSLLDPPQHLQTSLRVWLYRNNDKLQEALHRALKEHDEHLRSTAAMISVPMLASTSRQHA